MKPEDVDYYDILHGADYCVGADYAAEYVSTVGKLHHEDVTRPWLLS